MSATCLQCGRERTAQDRDYSPLQVLTGRAIGWYSGDDGEVCGACMARIVGGLRCPHCGRKNDQHEGPSPGDAPKPGDAGMCWGCRKLFIFTESQPRKPTDEELAEMEASPEVQSVREIVAGGGDPIEATDRRWKGKLPSPRCPGCDQEPKARVGTQAFCGNDSCHVLVWQLDKPMQELIENAGFVELPDWLGKP